VASWFIASAPTEIPTWVWPLFLAFLGVLVVLDLGLLQKRSAIMSWRQAIVWCVVWWALALVFAAVLGVWRGPEVAELFVGGYVLELALSVDNLFLFILIFAYFKIPPVYQKRVLFWGVLGAVLARAAFIFLGIAALERFGWLLPLFGFFLQVTGLKFLWGETQKQGHALSENFLIKSLQKTLPLTDGLRGDQFTVIEAGRRMVTPLLLVLVVIEATDLLFALDSVPAVLGILPIEMSTEERRFVAFTSNLFAILGLRSMYFALVGLERWSRFLKPALALILIFIGIKMTLPWMATWGQAAGSVASWVPNFCLQGGQVGMGTETSLAVIGGILLLAVFASWLMPPKR
jgi:tellurite resistance protein TerC